MVEIIKPERLKFETEPKDILAWEEDDDRIIQRVTRKEKTMGKKVGTWLDRNKAVVVSIAEGITGRAIITSDMEHYALYSKIVPGDGASEDPRNRRFWNHLGEYYDEIIANLRDADEIQIFGPEDAKYELQKYLEAAGLADRIVSVEDAGKMTDLQITAKVEKRFPSRSQFDIF